MQLQMARLRRLRRAAACQRSMAGHVSEWQGAQWAFMADEGWVLQDVIVSERRFQYEADVAREPLNYDAWFDYIRLEESAGQPARVRAA